MRIRDSISRRCSARHAIPNTTNIPLRAILANTKRGTPLESMPAKDNPMPKRLWRLCGGTGKPPTLGEWQDMLERRKERRKQGVTQFGWADHRGGGFTLGVTSGRGSKKHEGASKASGCGSGSSVRSSNSASNVGKTAIPEAHGALTNVPRAGSNHH